MVGDHWGHARGTESGPFPRGATLRIGATAWVYGEDPARLLGGALAWAGSCGVAELHLIAEAGTDTLARRAAAFSSPPTVWRLHEGRLDQAAPEPLGPEPAPPAVPPELASAFEAARAAGAEVVTEHGVVSVEVLGLEVARLEPGPDGPDLSIGVGRHDRDARRAVHAGRVASPLDAAQELAAVVAHIRARRTAGAASHPANQLAPERWLRAVMVRRPELVGSARLRSVSPPAPRANLRARGVAPAAGVDADGSEVVVVCSTGVDPELVPESVDVRHSAQVGGRAVRLALVVPERDDHPLTRRLAVLLAEPAEIRTVPSDWRLLGP